MKIEKITINGYGKWIDQTFDLNPNLQIFYGLNESGKSTLQSFIHSVFFGFPGNKKNVNNYKSSHTSNYGGRIHLTDSALGNVIVDRKNDGSAAGEVTIIQEDQSKLDKLFLQTLLHDVDQKLYKQFYSFNLDDLEQISKLKPEELENDFLNISVAGAKEYFDISNKLDTEAGNIYKSNGYKPTLNVALTQLNEDAQLLQVAEDKNKAYLDQMEELKQIDGKVTALNDSLNQLEKSKAKLKFLANHFEQYERYRFLTADLNQSKKVISIDDQHNFKKWWTTSQELANQIDQLNRELKSIQAKYFTSDKMDDYLLNKAYYVEQFERLPELQELVSRWSQVKLKLDEKQTTLAHLRQQLSIGANAPSPTPITDQDHIQLQAWQTQIVEAQKEIQAIDSELVKLDYEKKLAERNQSDASVSSNQLFASVGIFAVVFLVSWIINLNLPLAFILSVIGAALTYVVMSKSGSDDSGSAQSVEDIQEQKQTLKNQQATLDAKIDTWMKEFQAFLIERQLSSALSLDELITNQHFYNDVSLKQRDIDELETKQQQLYEQLQSETASLDELTYLYPSNYRPEERVLNLNQFKQTVEKELQANEEINQNISYITKQLETLNHQADSVESKLQQVMQKYNESSITVFNQLIKESARLEDTRAELANLTSILSQYPDILETDKVFKQTEVSQELTRIDQQLSDIKAQKDQLFEKKSDITLEMKTLEEGKEYTQIRQNYENQLSEVDELIEEWLVTKLASSIIQTTIRQGVKEQLPAIIDQATTYFNRLTDGKYNQIVINDDGIQVVNQSGDYFPILHLSRGTAEPLYAAIRLAVIKNRAEELPLPIMIDDSFVNVDETRKTMIYDILEEISSFNQVILYTFDQAVLNRFDQANITELTR